ncbi:hypothetical protein N24_1440 [Corynebacterium suranareeae]|uniref:Uncharacterized protein n=1 Tax=Corynebacterium suranareeae TaxID=2506452 RepID=A0A169RVR7_9CORY|nr:hypothetical protein [Corynebacterium suranareeae]BAU95702.1 hypothetical protein N24_1440 [Corynebacterium suranareeae]
MDECRAYLYSQRNKVTYHTVEMFPRWSRERYSIFAAVDQNSERLLSKARAYPRSDFYLEWLHLTVLDLPEMEGPLQDGQVLYYIYESDEVSSENGEPPNAYEDYRAITHVEQLEELGSLNLHPLCATVDGNLARHLVDHISNDLLQREPKYRLKQFPNYIKAILPWYSDFFLENFPYSDIKFPDKAEILREAEQAEFNHWVHGIPFPHGDR